jgi:penicillin-binding protein 1A
MLLKTKKNPEFKNHIKWFWMLIFGGTILMILIFILASLGVFGKLPSFDELENPENNLASEVISVDGKTLGKFFHENRTPVQYQDLPQHLIDALIATEDERFYNHSGIDARGTLRAVVMLGKGGGASTISQQLAKNLFTKKVSGNIVLRIIQKIKEWVIAIRLETQYTKQEILVMYFNKYDFNYNAVGIRSAARIYFGKEPIELDLHESAMLVGMLKNSSLYNPIRRAELVQARRNQVFIQMYRNDFINRQERDSLKQLSLNLNINKEDTAEGMATYFREYVRDYMKTWIKNNPKPDGSEYNIYRDGLKIYVTIDSRMQQYAEEATQEHISNLQKIFFREHKKNKTAPFYQLNEEEIKTTMDQSMKRSDRWYRMKQNGASEDEIRTSFKEKTAMRVFSWKGDFDTIMSPYDSIRYYKHFLQSGLIAIEPQTGHVKAWVGGTNYKHFQYDHVKLGKRQVGSTFKPFVYATAINQLNMSPCDKLPNTPFTIPKEKYGMPEDWTPKNSNNEYGGEQTLKQALANSVNVITARLIDKVSPITVVRLAKSAGIETEIAPNPSIALGAIDLSLFELTGAYSTFANKGLRVEQMMILRIEDKNGMVLQEFTPKTKEVMDEESAYLILNLLEGVTLYGSGARLRSGGGSYPDNMVTGFPYKFTNPIAGKTGTTQNQSDGWFMGMVPNLATGVWVGNEDRAAHFYGISRGQGATMALPIWALFYKKCYEDTTLNLSKEAFEKPANLSVNLDCNQPEGANEDDELGVKKVNTKIEF